MQTFARMLRKHLPISRPASWAFSACARQAACPKRVVFVLKETEPERWISNGGDFYAYLKPPGVDEVVEKVCDLL